MTPEEARVLSFLHKRLTAPAAEVARACLHGGSIEWLNRVVARLEWFGFVNVFYGPNGEATAVQITDQGMRQLAG